MTLQPVTAVHLTASAARVITAELRTADHTTETGGILLGHHTRDAVTVRHAGTPGPAAVRTPRYFLRDLAHAQTLADEAFTTDASVWAGEWHTHPTGPPALSARDTATYRQCRRDNGRRESGVAEIALGKCGELGFFQRTIAKMNNSPVSRPVYRAAATAMSELS